MTGARSTAVVVTYRSAGIVEHLRETLEALSGSCATVLIDNDSPDGTLELLASRIPWAGPFSTGANRGFGSACNLGLSRVATPYTLFLNHDARIPPGSLRLLEEALDGNPRTAGVQPHIRAWGWPEVTASRGIGITSFYEGFDLGFMRFEPWSLRGHVETAGITAAVSLWRTDVLRRLSGFDPGIFMYFEDVDLSIRARLDGWDLGVVPEASAEHMVGVSSNRAAACAWELSSAFHLAMKYGPSRRLTRRRFLKRELRVLLSGLARLRFSPARPAALVSSILSGQGARTPFVPPTASPRDLPRGKRIPPFQIVPGGGLLSGPGWTGERSFLGFGAFTAERDCRLNLRLRSERLPSTGRLWLDGQPCEPFLAASEWCDFSCRLEPGRCFLASDDPEMLVHVSDPVTDGC